MNNIWAIPLAAIYFIVAAVVVGIGAEFVFEFWLGFSHQLVLIISGTLGVLVGLSTVPFYFWLRDL